MKDHDSKICQICCQVIKIEDKYVKIDVTTAGEGKKQRYAHENCLNKILKSHKN